MYSCIFFTQKQVAAGNFGDLQCSLLFIAHQTQNPGSPVSSEKQHRQFKARAIRGPFVTQKVAPGMTSEKLLQPTGIRQKSRQETLFSCFGLFWIVLDCFGMFWVDSSETDQHTAEMREDAIFKKSFDGLLQWRHL